MPLLNVVSTESTTGSSTTGTSFVDANCTQSIPDLGTGLDYFCAYRTSFGGNDNAQVGALQAIHSGAVGVYGEAAGEGAGGSANEFWHTGHLQGFARLTVDGTQTVKVQHKNITSSDTNYVGAQSIVLIPLNQHDVIDPVDGGFLTQETHLNENADYFYSGTNSATAEVSSVGSTWTTARTVDFSIQTAGEYYVFFSVEAAYNASGSTASATCARFQIAGTTQSSEWQKEWEDDNDRNNFAYADRVTLSAGTTTFRIQVKNKGSATIINAYRGRIWAFRAESFGASALTVDSTGDAAITHTAYSDSEIFLDTAYANYGSSFGIAVATFALGGAGQTVVEMRKSGSIGRCVDAGAFLNNVTADIMPTVIWISAAIADSGNIRVRHRAAPITGTIGRDALGTSGIRSNLFYWQLSRSELAPGMGHSKGFSPSLE